MVAGTGIGKTFALINQIVKDCLIDGSRFYDVLPYQAIIIAPTYLLLRQVHWPLLLHYSPEEAIEDIEISQHKIVYTNYAEVLIRSGTDPDTIRALRPNKIAIDECRLMDEYVYEMATTRLAYRKGDAYLATTPERYDWSYNIEERAATDPGIRVIHGKSVDNPLFDPERIARARAIMDESLFRQEFYGERRAGGSGVYIFDRETHASRRCELDKELPFYFAMDFNVDPMTCVILQPHGPELWIIDEISLRNSNTWEICKAIRERYGKFADLGQDDPPFISNWFFYPDPSAVASQHGGHSNISIIKKYFRDVYDKQVYVKMKRKAPRVMNRINAVNAKLKNADGFVGLYIDPSCKFTIQALERCEYKEGTNIVDKSKGIEHPADAVGYAIEYEYPIKKATVGGL